MAAPKRVNRNCFICGSEIEKENAKDNVKFGSFKVPLSKIAEWQSVILRPGLKSSSRLCDRHFDEEDIVKGKTIQNVFYPNSIWKLKPDAIPKHFLQTLSNNCKLFELLLIVTKPFFRAKE